MLKFIVFLMGILAAQGAFADQMVLVCASPSHEGYSAELYFDRSHEKDYALDVKVDGSLKYTMLFDRLPDLDLHLQGDHLFKFGQPTGMTTLFFSPVSGRKNAFVLQEATFLPPQFEERAITFLCGKH